MKEIQRPNIIDEIVGLKDENKFLEIEMKEPIFWRNASGVGDINSWSCSNVGRLEAGT